MRKEFARRLVLLSGEIDYALESGQTDSLLPALFSVYSYLWSTLSIDYLFKIKKERKV